MGRGNDVPALPKLSVIRAKAKHQTNKQTALPSKSQSCSPDAGEEAAAQSSLLPRLVTQAERDGVRRLTPVVQCPQIKPARQQP